MFDILASIFVFALSHPLCSHFAITLGSRKDRTDLEHLYDKGPKLRSSRDRPPSRQQLFIIALPRTPKIRTEIVTHWKTPATKTI
jgi:hypothetical protein